MQWDWQSPQFNVFRIGKKKLKLSRSLFAAHSSFSNVTRRRSTIMKNMEKLLDTWIEDNNQQRIPMSQITIQEKAKRIFEILMKEDSDVSMKSFQGSRGWFEKFKNRHN